MARCGRFGRRRNKRSLFVHSIGIIGAHANLSREDFKEGKEEGVDRSPNSL
jgi:hypothetical protein